MGGWHWLITAQVVHANAWVGACKYMQRGGDKDVAMLSIVLVTAQEVGVVPKSNGPGAQSFLPSTAPPSTPQASPSAQQSSSNSPFLSQQQQQQQQQRRQQAAAKPEPNVVSMQGEDPLLSGQQAAHAALSALRDQDAAAGRSQGEASSSSNNSGSKIISGQQARPAAAEGNSQGEGGSSSSSSSGQQASFQPDTHAYAQLEDANRRLREANDKLMEANSKLQEANLRLEELNRRLVEERVSKPRSTYGVAEDLEEQQGQASKSLEEEAAGALDSRSFLEGMRGFALQALDMYTKEGYSLTRLIGWQVTVSKGMPPGSAQQIMQQYTRIVILTCEVLAAKGLMGPPGEMEGFDASVSSVEDDLEEEPGDARAPLSFLASFSSIANSMDLDEEETRSARPLALRLLVAFMGAVLGAEYSSAKFVEGVCLAYSEGWTASEILAELCDADFLQSGGLVTSDAAATGGQTTEVNKELFIIWLSTVYMGLARMGAVFPNPKQGWAYAGSDSMQAIGLDQFVENALAQCERDHRKALQARSSAAVSSEAGGSGQAPLGIEEADVDPFIARLRSNATVARLLDEERQAAALQFVMEGKLGNKELPDSLMRVEDKELPMNSAAYRLIKAQSDLVARTYALSMSMRQHS
ncbi:hypothetical protein DUNSADRAFT_11823 [Dunaliella salina]|uniref:Uncharacterized protein n=1 Tax=Dunaliella salina TaxID=3046 RepID=A0ABQ7GCI4_DUNSA|nr:hypothetical protein DUNSADRAFT_11823 [Dunaliella salina]|eukprot:KAF5832314.1 hypothetical protein DUNSADRAFT_11823 [Dunaliella salina]